MTGETFGKQWVSCLKWVKAPAFFGLSPNNKLLMVEHGKRWLTAEAFYRRNACLLRPVRHFVNLLEGNRKELVSWQSSVKPICKVRSLVRPFTAIQKLSKQTNVFVNGNSTYYAIQPKITVGTGERSHDAVTHDAFREVDVVKTTHWRSKRASEFGRTGADVTGHDCWCQVG